MRFNAIVRKKLPSFKLIAFKRTNNAFKRRKTNSVQIRST